jgi:hypothetical protein
MYNAFLSRALPVLHSLGFPLIDDPDRVSFGTSPINANSSRTWLNFESESKSARMVAMVALPMPGMEARGPSFVLSPDHDQCGRQSDL